MPIGAPSEVLAVIASGGQHERRLLREAVAALPPLERQLLALIYAEGLTNAEASRVLRVPEAFVEHLLEHALRCLAETTALLAA